MKIKLDNDFYIREDNGTSICLFEVKTALRKLDDKNGEFKEGDSYEREVQHGFFPDVNMAVQKYIKIKAIENTAECATLRDYVNEYKAISERVEKAIKGIDS